MTARLRQLLGLVLRLAVAAVVIGYLLRKMGIEQLGQSLRMTARRWPWLLAAHLVMGLPLVLCAVRWKLILERLGMAIAGSRSLAIFFIGLFFNSFMIGATGGDVVKAYYTARETHHLKTEAVTSVVIDRVVGMIALCLLVTLIISLRLPFFLSHPETRAASVAILVLCGGILCVCVLLFSRNLFTLLPWLARWEQRPRIGRAVGVLRRAYNAFFVCRERPAFLGSMILLSTGIQSLAILSSLCVGHALDLRVAWTEYFSFCPIIGLISAIPVTPGGLGLREGSAVHLLAVLGVGPDKAFLVAFLPYLSLLIWGLAGGLVFMVYKSGAGHSLPQDLDDPEQETPAGAPPA
jgi:glycosyltransferase 2 family protein